MGWRRHINGSREKLRRLKTKKIRRLENWKLGRWEEVFDIFLMFLIFAEK